ncbi:hypothetical protein [uncultured Sneathiella sp.]|jgi:hypothetical protein|uniref:hypothetical protein n=1 Tax=uncultured Sneathiella sp. TaxID=879315 RepID=UPI0030DB488C|tara:strand:- start:963 stop:3215 length:2253 start_codon:yes stop_codon:yes gene_type:complete
MKTLDEIDALAIRHAEQDKNKLNRLKNPGIHGYAQYIERFKYEIGTSSPTQLTKFSFHRPINENNSLKLNDIGAQDNTVPKLFKLLSILLCICATPYMTALAASYYIPAATEAVATEIAQTLIPSSIANKTRHGINCALRITVVDKDDNLLGYNMTDSQACKLHMPSHRTSSLSEKAIQEITRGYKVLEGEYFGAGTILGFDLLTPVRVVFSGFTQGGSTPLETAQKNANGLGGSLNTIDKLKSIFLLPVTAGHIAPTERQRDRFVAEHTPCMTGLSGSGLGGVLAGNFCGMIFGRASLGDPTVGEGCVIAAAARYPIQFLGLNDATEGRLAEQIVSQTAAWGKTVHRAKVCVQRLEKKNVISTEIAAIAFAEIDQMQPPLPKPAGYYNPDTVLKKMSPGLKVLQIGEAGLSKSKRVLKTSIDGPAQRKLSETFEARVSSLLLAADDQLCFGVQCHDERKLDYAVFMGELHENQLLTRVHYETRHRLLSGPKTGAVHRSLGSLDKSIIAPLLAELGVKKVCLHPIYNLQDSNGFTGNEDCHNNTRTMLNIYATSSNLGFANALTIVPKQQLINYLSTAGFQFNHNASASQLKRGLTLGNSVVLSPLKFIQAFVAITTNGQAPVPTIIEGRRGNILSMSGLIKPDSINTARNWLSGSLSSIGTANNLGKKLKTAGCVGSIGKTGTSDSVAEKKWRDKLIAFSTKCGDRTFVVFAMIGSPDVKIPLGGISTNNLIRLAWPSFKALIRNGGSR